MASTSDMVAELHANIEPFRRGMREAQTTARQSTGSILTEFQKLERRIDGLTAPLNRLQGVFTSFGRLAAGGGALAGVTAMVRNTLDTLAGIQKAADSIGITTDSFQELSFAMSRAGVATSEQSQVLRTYAERAFEAAQGNGALYEALLNYNPEALKALRQTGDLAGQLGVLAEAVKNASGEQQRAALMTAAFGRSNDDLRRFLVGGQSAIQTSIEKAREYGIVLDEELVRKAPEIQEKFEALSAAISTQFQQALVAGAPIIVEFAQTLADLLNNVVFPAIDGFNALARAVNSAVGMFSEIGDRSLNTLNDNLASVNEEIAKLERRGPMGAGDFMSMIGVDAEEAERRLAKLRETRDALQQEIERRGWVPSFEVTPSFRSGTGVPDRGGRSGGGSAGSANRALSELERIHKEMLRVTGRTTELIQFEHDKQLESLQSYLREGLISVQQFEQARQELATITTVKLQEEAFKQFEPVANAISSNLTRAFDEFVQTGKLNFQELARSMLADLAKVAFQMSVIQPLFGGAPGQPNTGGAFGSLLAGVFHDGGIVGAGGPRREIPGLAFATAPRFHDGGFPGLRAGEVPAILERGEMVVPKERAGRMGGGIVFNISTPDADSFRRSEGQITAMIARATQRGRRNM